MIKMKYFTAILLIFFISSSASADDKSFLFAPDGANFYVYGRGADTFIINQNRIASLQIDKQIKQLSSGKRINNASDDPSGLAVAEKMDSLLQQLSRESANDEDMRNLGNYVESMIALDQEIVNRIRELIIRSSGGILTAGDREYSQAEIDELLKQVDMNARYSQFNTVSVIPELTSKNLGLDDIDVVRDTQAALGIADDALSKLTRSRVLQGVRANILTFRIEGRSYQYLNLRRSESGIRDIDMEEGITELIKNSVLLKSRYGLILRSK